MQVTVQELASTLGVSVGTASGFLSVMNKVGMATVAGKRSTGAKGKQPSVWSVPDWVNVSAAVPVVDTVTTVESQDEVVADNNVTENNEVSAPSW